MSGNSWIQDTFNYTAHKSVSGANCVDVCRYDARNVRIFDTKHPEDKHLLPIETFTKLLSNINQSRGYRPEALVKITPKVGKFDALLRVWLTSPAIIQRVLFPFLAKTLERKTVFTMSHPAWNSDLHFSIEEIDAFFDGVRKAEFDRLVEQTPSDKAFFEKGASR